MKFRPAGRRRVGIDIAPLVDVVFLLVIFFAVSTTFLETSGLKLELPRSSATAAREGEEIAVLLSADGSIYFGDRQVTPQELSAQLGRTLGEAETKVVVLRADTTTSHGRVVEVMDLIRQAGADGLTVATRAARE